ncbi:hypothetical protein J2I47_25690 [Fibrella sp. HMF5335]|uniref:Outer membrane protein beta-barrel domain-containing protein n=1 Tax=Fibrella rubiginis TaxID=2817060 RepID=A0A939GJ03_9BACT|nr:hypothetical protein [Fibrella rubiginis]MBO0939964.1 hypothetical protein [Fibrella rubiginis]
MNKLIYTSLLMLLAVVAQAQDNIILKSGQEVPAKVLEVSKADIKYKRTDNPDGPIYTITAGEVFMIKYANGTKDVLSAQPQPPMIGPRMGNPRMDAPPMDQPNRALGRRQGRLRPGFDRFNDRAPAMPGGAAPALVGLRYHSGLFSHYFVDGQGVRLAYGEVRSLMAGQPDALRALQRGRQLRVAALVTAIPAVALLGTGIALAADGHRGGRFGRGFDPNDNLNNRNERGGDRVVGAALAGGGLLLGITSAVLSHKATVRFRAAAARYRAGEGTSLQLVPAQQGLGAGLTLRF